MQRPPALLPLLSLAASTAEPFHANYRKTFNALALLIVRSNPHTAVQSPGAHEPPRYLLCCA